MARSPFWAATTAPQDAQNRRTSQSGLVGFCLNSDRKFDEERAGRLKVNFQHNGAKTELQFGVRRLMCGRRGVLYGFTALEHTHDRAQDGLLYHERRRATPDERRTHYQRIHFSSLAKFDARMLPSDSELSQEPLKKHIVQNAAPHYDCSPNFILQTVEELTVDDGLTANSNESAYLFC